MIEMVVGNATFDITQIPVQLGTALGVSESIAQMMISAFILMMCMLPIFLGRGKPATVIVVGMAVLGVLTAMGWMEPIVTTLILLVAAAFLATKARDWIGG
jgi:hypothetical protein